MQLEGLEPGKTYHYRVVSKEIVKLESYQAGFGKEVVSKTFTFRTCDPGKETFSFCVVADNHEQSQRLGRQLTESTGTAWTSWFSTATWSMISIGSRSFSMDFSTCARRSLPAAFLSCSFVAITKMRGGMACRLFDFVPTPEGRFYYSFDHGKVHFIVLDSGEDKEDSDKEYSGLADFDAYRRTQAKWLQADIRGDACSKSNFRIAIFHMPTRGGDDWHGECDIRKRWEPLLNQGNIDLAICGHTHKTPTSSQVTAPTNTIWRLDRRKPCSGSMSRAIACR